MTCYTTAPNIYAQQLVKLGYGWPLWVPEPREIDGVPHPVEVEIGDVGCTVDGRFIRLFNAMTGGQNPEYADSVPEGHAPLKLPDGVHDKLANLTVDTMLSYGITQETKVSAEGTAHSAGASISFECQGDQAAFLILKERPTRERLIAADRQITAYVANNYKKWLTFAEESHMDIDEARLQFVDGWVKTSAWALGCIIQQGRKAQLSVEADFSVASAKLSASRETTIMPIYRTRAGPPTTILAANAMTNTPAAHGKNKKKRKNKEIPPDYEAENMPMNQCVFMHYFKVKRRLFLGTGVMRAAAEPRDLERDRENEADVNALKVREEHAGDDEDLIIEHVPDREIPYDPVGYLLDYILENSHADLAIASDRQLVAACGDTVPDDIPGYLRVAKPDIEITEDGAGVLSLTRNSLPASFLPSVAEFIGAQAHSDDPEQMMIDDSRANLDAEAMDEYTNHEDDISSLDEANKETKRPLMHTTHGAVADTIGINTLAYSPDGSLLVAGTERGNILVRTIAGSQADVVVEAHESASIRSLAFSPDGSQLITAANNGEMKVWQITPHIKATKDNPEGWTVQWSLSGEDGFADAVAWSPDGQIVTTASAFDIKLWNTRTGIPVHTLSTHEGIILVIRFSPDGHLIASAGADMTVRIWETQTGTERAVLSGHESVIYTLAWAPDGRRIVTGADEGSARIWKTETGEELVTLREHAGPIWKSAFSEDGRSVLTASGDGQIKVCNSYAGEVLRSIEMGEGVSCAGFSRDGKLAYSVAGDHIVRVWEVETGSSVAEFAIHEDSVKVVEFSPDGRNLASASDDGTLQILAIPRRQAMKIGP